MSSDFLVKNSNFYKSKLYFSKYELKSILSFYSFGVSKGYWKDYSINFKTNEAIFSIYKHAFASPTYCLIKYKLKKKSRVLYKLKEKKMNNKNQNVKNFEELIIYLKKSNLKIIN